MVSGRGKCMGSIDLKKKLKVTAEYETSQLMLQASCSKVQIVHRLLRLFEILQKITIVDNRNSANSIMGH